MLAWGWAWRRSPWVCHCLRHVRANRLDIWDIEVWGVATTAAASSASCFAARSAWDLTQPWGESSKPVTSQYHDSDIHIKAQDKDKNWYVFSLLIMLDMCWDFVLSWSPCTGACHKYKPKCTDYLLHRPGNCFFYMNKSKIIYIYIYILGVAWCVYRTIRFTGQIPIGSDHPYPLGVGTLECVPLFHCLKCIWQRERSNVLIISWDVPVTTQQQDGVHQQMSLF